MRRTLIAECLILLELGVCAAVYKKWLPNANFENGANWNAGRPPCGNDRVLIHEESAAVYIQMDTTLQELALPMNGEVIFGPSSQLTFTNSPDHSATCTPYTGVVEFNVTYPRDWFNPKNWCQTASETGSCQSADVIDSEKIPCSNDDVVFPKNNSFFVNVETGAKINVNTFKISGMAYTTNTLQAFLDTDAGRRTFPIPRSGARSSITIQRRPCTDPTGCSCGNAQPQILDRICKLQSPHCVKPQCQTTLKPQGACCGICGALLTMEYGTGFRLATLHDGLRRNVLDKTDAFRAITFIVSKLSSGSIQIVVSDDSGQNSIQAGNALFNEIQNDITAGGFRYSITKIRMETSAGGGGPTAGKQSSAPESLPAGEIAGIVVGLGVLLIVLLLAAVFIYRRKSRSTDELGFNVFDKINFKKPNFRKPRVEVPPSFGFRFGGPTENVGPSAQGFDNPMYGNNPLENEKPMDLEMMPASAFSSEDQPTFDSFDTSRGFDNPLYDTSPQQESLFADPTSVADDNGKPEVDETLPSKTESPQITVTVSPFSH